MSLFDKTEARTKQLDSLEKEARMVRMPEARSRTAARMNARAPWVIWPRHRLYSSLAA